MDGTEAATGSTRRMDTLLGGCASRSPVQLVGRRKPPIIQETDELARQGGGILVSTLEEHKEHEL